MDLGFFRNNISVAEVSGMHSSKKIIENRIPDDHKKAQNLSESDSTE
jgi:hypothetical protein